MHPGPGDPFQGRRNAKGVTTRASPMGVKSPHQAAIVYWLGHQVLNLASGGRYPVAVRRSRKAGSVT